MRTRVRVLERAALVWTVVAVAGIVLIVYLGFGDRNRRPSIDRQQQPSPPGDVTSRNIISPTRSKESLDQLIASFEPTEPTQAMIALPSDTATQWDRKWEECQRNALPIILLATRQPWAIDCAQLYRNKYLNPRDIYIPMARRQLLTTLLQQYQDHSRETRKLLSGYVRTGVADLIKNGRIEPVPEGVDIDRHVGEGFLGVRSYQGGQAYAVSYDLLPEAKAVYDYHVFRNREFAGILLNTFAALGALPESMAAQLYKQINK